MVRKRIESILTEKLHVASGHVPQIMKGTLYKFNNPIQTNLFADTNIQNTFTATSQEKL